MISLTAPPSLLQSTEILDGIFPNTLLYVYNFLTLFVMVASLLASGPWISVDCPQVSPVRGKDWPGRTVYTPGSDTSDSLRLLDRR